MDKLNKAVRLSIEYCAHRGRNRYTNDLASLAFREAREPEAGMGTGHAKWC